MRGYAGNKDELRARLRRVEGQIRGIQQMVEDDRYCIDILTQISAAGRALRKVAVGLLDEHIRDCVVDGPASTREREARIAEATAAVDRILRA